MKMLKSRLAPALAVALALASMAALPSGSPESLGFSAARLHRVDDVIQRYIDNHQISGAVTVVARHGQIAHYEAQGLMDIEAKTPMRKDAIFRMASMSKPVTGVAILMLMEEGKLRLTDPVAKFIPEFKDMSVAMPKPGAAPAGRGRGNAEPEIYTVPASRDITIRDLLTHTSGLESSGLGNRTASRMAPRRGDMNLAQYVPTLGKTPLDFQPGTRWQYSLLSGMETLGRIVEITSGQTFDQFLKTRLFDPLGMKDTSFVVPAEKKSRLVTLYDDEDGKLARSDPQTPGWLNTTTLFSGGGGLYSTADDYMAFAQMLANKGELNGQRILGTRTVEMMATNHVGDLFAEARSLGSTGLGFGLSVQVVLDPVAANIREGTGSFGWGGAFGTNFWVDPENDLVGLLMIQEPVNSLRNDFANAVMQAIVE